MTAHPLTHVSCHDGKIVTASLEDLEDRALNCGWDVWSDERYGTRFVKEIGDVIHIAACWTVRDWRRLHPDTRLMLAGMEG